VPVFSSGQKYTNRPIIQLKLKMQSEFYIIGRNILEKDKKNRAKNYPVSY